MALTFKFFTTTGLTVAFSNLYQLTHETDLSDNPQDFNLFFGSMGSAGADTADRQLQASSSPGVDQITLTPTVVIPIWVGSTAYTVGQTRIPTAGNTYRYEVTTAGTSAIPGSEPSWPTSIGSTVVDGTVLWTCVSKVHPATEIKLALTQGGLAGATGGAALNLGTTITSGSSNDVSVWIRVTNTVTTVESNTGTPELALYINAVEETAV